MAAAAILGGGVAFWWRLPKLQSDCLRLTIRDPKARADIEDNIRKTIGQLLGGAAVLIGAGLAYMQFTQQQRTSQQQFTQQQQAAHDLLISNQVSKGFEQLGSDKIVIRLGGIYALEGVIKTSMQYYQPVLDSLCAFVRDRTRTKKGDDPPDTDVQAALTVITRSARHEFGYPDLANAHIPKAVLAGAQLDFATLTGADLKGADLYNVSLYHTHLAGANLEGANMIGDILTGADLSGADLRGADLYAAKAINLNELNLFPTNLTGADLTGAYLSVANLTGVALYGAHLKDANLTAVNLTGAHLSGADLTGANLGGARLTRADLTGAKLDHACGVDVTRGKLDPSLTLKPCP